MPYVLWMEMVSCAIESNVVTCVGHIKPTWDATLSYPILDAIPG